MACLWRSENYFSGVGSLLPPCGSLRTLDFVASAFITEPFCRLCVSVYLCTHMRLCALGLQAYLALYFDVTMKMKSRSHALPTERSLGPILFEIGFNIALTFYIRTQYVA